MFVRLPRLFFNGFGLPGTATWEWDLGIARSVSCLAECGRTLEANRNWLGVHKGLLLSVWKRTSAVFGGWSHGEQGGSDRARETESKMMLCEKETWILCPTSTAEAQGCCGCSSGWNPFCGDVESCAADPSRVFRRFRVGANQKKYFLFSFHFGTTSMTWMGEYKSPLFVDEVKYRWTFDLPLHSRDQVG